MFYSKNVRLEILMRFLKEKRLEQGLTRTELAKHLGYSSTIISCWERGLEISECEAEDICVYFGIEVYD